MDKKHLKANANSTLSNATAHIWKWIKGINHFTKKAFQTDKQQVYVYAFCLQSMFLCLAIYVYLCSVGLTYLCDLAFVSLCHFLSCSCFVSLLFFLWLLLPLQLLLNRLWTWAFSHNNCSFSSDKCLLSRHDSPGAVAHYGKLGCGSARFAQDAGQILIGVIDKC